MCNWIYFRYSCGHESTHGIGGLERCHAYLTVDKARKQRTKPSKTKNAPPQEDKETNKKVLLSHEEKDRLKDFCESSHAKHWCEPLALCPECKPIKDKYPRLGTMGRLVKEKERAGERLKAEAEAEAERARAEIQGMKMDDTGGTGTL
jgi:hypothetical protein